MPVRLRLRADGRVSARRAERQPRRAAPHVRCRGRRGDAARDLADPHLVAVLARYAARMGVDPALVWSAESLSPGVLRILSAQEIARWRLGAARL